MGALGYELFVGLATQVIDPVRKEELVWLTPPDSFIIYSKYSKKLRGSYDAGGVRELFVEWQNNKSNLLRVWISLL